MKITADQKIIQRLWGSFQNVAGVEGHKVKKNVLNPGQMVSLQMHTHRSEPWLVVRGTAPVIGGSKSGLWVKTGVCTFRNP